MTVPLRPRGKAARRRRRRVRTKPLVLLAVAASLTVMVGRGAAQIMASADCPANALLINVAASSDIAPAIEQVAAVFNAQRHRAGGRCIAVQVEPGPPAEAAGQIDGEHPAAGQPPIDAWIPDSSLWVAQARSFPVGAQRVRPAGFSVARSPLLIVMPAAAATRTAAFARATWRLLLPRSAGGPRVPSALRVDLPDPAQSAAGLATLIEIGRLLGPRQAGRVRFARFVDASSVTPYFDDTASLASFVSLAAPPLDGYPVTVTTEQAVLAYDEAHPRQPLAARYPVGRAAAYGSPELDYPYVLTTTNRLRLAAVTAFGQMLRGGYAQAVIRFAGFRSASGVPDAFPASSGLSDQQLQVAPAAAPGEAPAALAVWEKIAAVTGG